MGADAVRFLDLLAAAGISVWQVLPLNPPDGHRSPYCSSSLFAGDPGLLPRPTSQSVRALDIEGRTDVMPGATPGEFAASDAPIADSLSFWLRDFAIFSVAHETFATSWNDWPAPLRDRQPAAITKFVRDHSARIAFVEARQVEFIKAWRQLRDAAHLRGISLFGDVPLYPSYDSADVWAHRELFQLASDGSMKFVAGVPPDYFSPTGQLWGNPIYDWSANAADNFAWWHARFAHAATLFDVVRIDHFRGLEAYWRVPADAVDASSGVWAEGPGMALFAALGAGSVDALVAEDLGDITPEVDALRLQLNLPGMRVLQFGFSGDPLNPHLPERVPTHCVYYTGTHDNDTTLGWYKTLDAEARRAVDRLLESAPATAQGAIASKSSMPWPLIVRALACAANTTIVPLQDLLGLDGAARMNVPGAAAGNWTWRFSWEQIPGDLVPRLRSLVSASSRLPGMG